MKNETHDLDAALRKLGLSRNKPVGKRMGSTVWVHKASAQTLLSSGIFNRVLGIADDYGLSTEIIRYESKTGNVALIECPGFDLEDEPVVGRSLLVTCDQNEKIKLTGQPRNPLIYHHKWMFVTDDYAGFDVEESKRRSLWWKTKMGKDRSLSSRIGRLSFWQSWLKTLD